MYKICNKKEVIEIIDMIVDEFINFSEDDLLHCLRGVLCSLAIGPSPGSASVCTPFNRSMLREVYGNVISKLGRVSMREIVEHRLDLYTRDESYHIESPYRKPIDRLLLVKELTDLRLKLENDIVVTSNPLTNIIELSISDSLGLRYWARSVVPEKDYDAKDRKIVTSFRCGYETLCKVEKFRRNNGIATLAVAALFLIDPDRKLW